MVRLDERLCRIKQQFIDRGKYFTINRGRQYGKTTTLYIVLTIDFQMLDTTCFKDEQMFITSFIECLEDLYSEKKLMN